MLILNNYPWKYLEMTFTRNCFKLLWQNKEKEKEKATERVGMGERERRRKDGKMERRTGGTSWSKIINRGDGCYSS